VFLNAAVVCVDAEETFDRKKCHQRGTEVTPSWRRQRGSIVGVLNSEHKVPYLRYLMEKVG